MGIKNRNIGSRIAPFTRTDNTGVYLNPGPWIGIIKNNVDPTCSGRLSVYIPQFGGADANNPVNWITVSYAGPFMGRTKRISSVNEYVDTKVDIIDQNENAFQSYGFWFVPPDINLRVLCVFANGDPQQGYWIACLSDPYSGRMTPGIGSVQRSETGSNTGNSPTTKGGYIWDPNKFSTHKMLQNYIQITDPNTGSVEIPYRLPVSEAVLDGMDRDVKDPYNKDFTNITNLKMLPQVNQTKILGIQGLAFDFSRGAISTSAMRESPSQAFGISTPGRLSVFKDFESTSELLPLIQQYAANKDALSPADQDKVEKALTERYRAGGHQFVMDDGTVDGYDQVVRIRSAQGNMILLDDTNGQIYIINKLGTSWIEMTPSGRIDIFTANDFSVRSQGDINFHSDQNINLNAVGSIQMHAGSDFRIESTNIVSKATNSTTIFSVSDVKIGAKGKLSLYSSSAASFMSSDEITIKGSKVNINPSGAVNQILDPGSITTYNQIEVDLQSGTQAWWQKGTFATITSRAPAHEPWPGHEVNSIRTFNVTQGTAGPVPINSSGSALTVNQNTISQQPKPTGKIPGLTDLQLKTLLASIAHSESSFPSSLRIDNVRYFQWPGGPPVGTVITNYQCYNSIGYAGKYQFGAAALQTLGYIQSGVKITTNKAIMEGPYWTGKNGITNLNAWMNSPSEQENAMLSYETANYNTLIKSGALTDNSTSEQIGGALFASQFGVGNSSKYLLTGNDIQIGTNPPISTYYNNGVSAIAQANNLSIAGVTA